MKYLLDNTRAPLTFSWGFLEAPIDAVGDAYVRWQRRILHAVKVNAVNLRLADAAGCPSRAVPVAGGPGRRDTLNIERSVAVINDTRGWEFKTTGTLQDFEQAERYAAKRIADRFTPEMLDAYCRALGIDLFEEDFYGGAGLITRSSPWFLPKLPTVTLAQARAQLGLRD